jgi:hypothetical protein
MRSTLTTGPKFRDHLCSEIKPNPVQHLDVVKVGLPELVDRRRLVLELAGCLDDDERRAGD